MRIIYLYIIFSFVFHFAEAQDLVINELMSSNMSTLMDEDGDTPDWIELYNKGNETINLGQYGISDRKSRFWQLPAVQLLPAGHIVLFASGKDVGGAPLYWETIIDQGDVWKYFVPRSEPDPSWKNVGFDDASWSEGPSGFGYGDGDDATEIVGEMAIFIRRTFDVADTGEIAEVILDMDYDDAFVAYINGHEIARANISSQGPPPFDQMADNADHEAGMYRGLTPDRFELGDISHMLINGKNVIAIQVHNRGAVSSDMSAIPFLSIGHRKGGDYKVSEFLELGSFGGLHTNFKLSSAGETLYLFRSDTLIDSLAFGELRSDISYGRSTDGASTFGLFTAPTPGSSNTGNVYQDYTEPVLFSESGGVKSHTIDLQLYTATGSRSIYYTTDGSEPNQKSKIYSAPIKLDSTVVIKAREINSLKIPGPVSSQTYLFVAGHGDLPVVSISTDAGYMFDTDTGIYMPGPSPGSPDWYRGANYWWDKEIPITIQMFDPIGEGFSTSAGLKIFGSFSRTFPQKSMAIHFRNSMAGPLRYKLFPNLPYEEFSSLVIRNNGNDHDKALMRDLLVGSLADPQIDKQAFRQSVVYINGKYWGLMNIREKVNEDFLATHHGVDASNISILENNSDEIEGYNEHYLEMLNFMGYSDMSLPDNYEFVKSQMDVSNFLKYFVLNIYLDNWDWPGNNIKYWRENTDSGKWRWITFGAEFAFDGWDHGNAFNTLSFALNPSGPGWPNPPWSTFLLRKLMENQEFENQFLTFFADELNSTYLPDTIHAMVDLLAGNIDAEMSRHAARWGRNMSTWQSQVELVKEFASVRPALMRQWLGQRFGVVSHKLTVQSDSSDYGFIMVNSLRIDQSIWEGKYFSGVPIVLKAIPLEGYRFVRWEGGFQSRDMIDTMYITGDRIVKPVFEKIVPKYHPVKITEINYSSKADEDDGDWFEVLNYGEENIDLSGWSIVDDAENTYVITGINTLEAEDYVVFAQDTSRFFNVWGDTLNVLGGFEFGLSSDGDCIRLYDVDMTLQDEICYLGTQPWPDSVKKSQSIGLLADTLDNQVISNWVKWKSPTPGSENELLKVDTAKTDTTKVIVGDLIETKNVNVFPNPTSGRISILLPPDLGEVDIQLYSLDGRLMAVIHNGPMNASGRIINWEAKGIDSGVYILKVKSGSKVYQQKLVIR